MDTLWNAFLALLVSLLENGFLYSPSASVITRYSILFYAVFKTATTLDDEKESSRWLKYWIFYGIVSFFCSYLSNGTLVKACVCGLLLLKFNVLLHRLSSRIGLHYPEFSVRRRAVEGAGILARHAGVPAGGCGVLLVPLRRVPALERDFDLQPNGGWRLVSPVTRRHARRERGRFGAGEAGHSESRTGILEGVQ